MAGDPVAELDVPIGELIDELDRTGFICLRNAVSPEWLQEARDAVKSNLARYGENDFCVIRPDSQQGTPAHQFVSDPAVRSLLQRLALARCPQSVSEHDEVYSVLRVLAGPETAATSFAYHYDAAVVTMLVPLFIPDAGRGRSGELVVFANKRPFRRSAVGNIAEKVATENRLYRWRMTRRLQRAPEKYAVVLEPGNVYLFWGYRTFHGNLPCAPNTVRATLLLHLGNPHPTSWVLAAVRELRRLVAPSSEHTEAKVIRF
jgi:hypothetical protein